MPISTLLFTHFIILTLQDFTICLGIKMKNLETNKIAAAILVAGLIALVSGKIAEALYHPEENVEKRGFSVEVASSGSSESGAPAKDEPVLVGKLMAEANAEEGAKIFKKCGSCHNAEKGGANKVGPNLAGVVGANKGTHPGFTYSDGMKSHPGKWSYEDLFAFIHKPSALIPGTKMTFAGLSNPKDIANVVAFLRTTGDNPPALPPVEK